MNKDLDLEYKQMIQEDLPDLWDRISAALPEKNNTAYVPNNNTIVDFAAQKKRKQTRIYRFAGIAAACACAAIAIPVAFMLSGQMRYQKSSEKTAAVQEMAAETAGAEKASAAPEYKAADEEYNVPMESAAEEPAAWEEEAEEAAVTEETAEAEAAAVMDGQVLLEGISVEIIRLLDQDETQEIYLGRIQRTDEDAGLYEDDRIVLIANEETDPAVRESLAKGALYGLDLLRDVDENGETVYYIL